MKPNRVLNGIITLVLASFTILLTEACGGGASQSGQSAPPVPTGASVRDAQLIAPDGGWALTDNDLRWTRDLGQTWRTILPEGLNPSAIKAVHFLDANNGWIFATTVASTASGTDITLSSSVLSTHDNGQHWSTVELESNVNTALAHFDFIDASNGWLNVDQGAHGAYPYGQIFTTTDGGASWIKSGLTLSGPTTFVNKLDGWIPDRNELNVSHDGGKTWQKVAIAAPADSGTASVVLNLMATIKSGKEIIPATALSTDGTRESVVFYSSRDGARSSSEIAAAQVHAVKLAVSLPIDVTDTSTWFIFVPNGTGPAEIMATHDAGKSWRSQVPSGLPSGGVRRIDFIDSITGWALDEVSVCKADKLDCRSVSNVYVTRDGGGSWVAATQ